MNIEVMYCPTADRLVRGRNVKLTALKGGDIKVTSTCPLHPGEKLTKVRRPEAQRDTYYYEVIKPGLSLPDVELPADPGLVHHPSVLFWTVFSRTVAAHLDGTEARMNWQVHAEQMWDDLTDEEREILMDRFQRTGRVDPEGAVGIPIDAFFAPSLAPAAKAAARRNPEKRPIADSRVKARYRELEAAIKQKRARYAALRDEYLEFDTDARRAIRFDYDMLARIVGDNEYPRLVRELEALSEKYGEGLFQ